MIAKVYVCISQIQREKTSHKNKYQKINLELLSDMDKCILS